jgi:hypothetical protein
MAVLDPYPGLTTEVIVDKQSLTEHTDEEDTSPTEVTKYIEARSGAEFMIKTTFRKPFPKINGVEIRVSVDGNRGCHIGIAPNELLNRSASNVTGVTFSQNGQRFHQRYQFAELKVGKHQ